MKKMKLYQYINNCISLLEHPENFAECEFSLLCERFPINTSLSNYLAKVLYISLKSPNDSIRIYPDKIKEYDIEYVILNSNSRRRISCRMKEFWVCGNNQLQSYKENDFYNYSLEIANNKTRDTIEKLRSKYQISPPEIFIGKHEDLILE